MLQQLQTVLAFAAIMLTMSILITALVQIVSSVLNLRGRSLYWGLRQILQRVDPDASEERADRLANAIVTHPTIRSGVRKRSVSAIAKDELYRVLGDLSAQSKEADPTTDSDSKQRIDEIAKSVLGVSPDDLKLYQDFGGKLADGLADEFPYQADRIRKFVKERVNQLCDVKQRTEAWFDSIMARASEQFTARVRLVTVLLAFLVAFGAQVDSVRIYDQLSNDAELRARVIQGVDETLRKAEESFVGAEIATKSLRGLASDATLPAADRKLLEKASANLESVADGEEWIENSTLTSKRDVTKKFSEAYQARLQTRIGSLGRRAKELRDDLEKASVKIVPEFSAGSGYFDYLLDWRHLLGMLMTGLLLSLGSPFWFNLLRQLSSLRPDLAEKLNPKGPGTKKKGKGSEKPPDEPTL